VVFMVRFLVEVPVSATPFRAKLHGIPAFRPPSPPGKGATTSRADFGSLIAFVSHAYAFTHRAP
jgi:hypothetical protein